MELTENGIENWKWIKRATLTSGIGLKGNDVGATARPPNLYSRARPYLVIMSESNGHKSQFKFSRRAPRVWVDLFYAPAFSMNLPDHLYSCLKYRDSVIFTKKAHHVLTPMTFTRLRSLYSAAACSRW